MQFYLLLLFVSDENLRWINIILFFLYQYLLSGLGQVYIPEHRGYNEEGYY